MIQSIAINDTASDIWEILIGVQQGSVLRPFLFTILYIAGVCVCMCVCMCRLAGQCRRGAWFTLFGLYCLTALGLDTVDTLKKYNIGFHLYADDTHIYLTCDIDDIGNATCRIETCIEEVRVWNAANVFWLNDNNTEFWLVGSISNIKKLDSIHLKLEMIELHLLLMIEI